MTDETEASLNDLMTELDTICERLQEGGQPLEESIDDFEKGTKLLKAAQATLANAEQKVRMISASIDEANEDAGS